MRRIASLVTAVALTFAMATAVLGYVQKDVSGLVPNDAAWAHYSVERNATDPGFGVKLRTLSWSGTDQYYYLRRCNNNNPIGAGSQSSPVKAAVNDSAFKQLGPLSDNQCFRMSAKKDWSWPTGNSWWTGTLRF